MIPSPKAGPYNGEELRQLRRITEYNRENRDGTLGPPAPPPHWESRSRWIATVDESQADYARVLARLAALRSALYELDGGDDVTIVGDLKDLLDDTAGAAARDATEHSAGERVEAFMRDNHFTKASFSSRLGLSTLNIELESEPPPEDRTP